MLGYPDELHQVTGSFYLFIYFIYFRSFLVNSSTYSKYFLSLFNLVFSFRSFFIDEFDRMERVSREAESGISPVS